MARNNQPLIIGAAALGGVALLATLFTVFGGGGAAPTPAGGAENAVQPPSATKTVYVARRDIPPRTALTSDLFTTREVPETEVPPGAVTDLNELRGLLSKQPIKSGDTATASLTNSAVRRVVPANIAVPQGLRAVAIFVNPDQTAAGLVDVGDRVDVIATHKFALAAAPNTRVEGAPQISAGRVIGQDLQVLAVDKSIAAPPVAPTPPPDPAAAGAPPPGAPAPPVAPTPVPPPNADARVRVLLAAPLDIATRLVAAGEEGKLHVVIRNPSGADRFPVPEAREYPSRLVAVPTPRTPSSGAANAGAARNASRAGDDGGSISYARGRNSGSSDSLPDLPVPQVETVPPARLPAGSGGSNGSNGSANSGGGLPAPGYGGAGGSGSFGGAGRGAPLPPPVPQENEVTVIRGTEKTRVLVPR